MLIGHTHTASVIDLMERSPFEFHLTGSRYFGYATKTSDWDFFVDSRPVSTMYVDYWLERNGFRRVEDDSYDTSDICTVWIHDADNVHVQVVRDAALSATVQASICRHLGARFGEIPKDMRKRVWEAAFAAYKAGQRDAKVELPVAA